VGGGQALLSAGWPPYSRLLLASDTEAWSVQWDMRELAAIAGRLGVRTRVGAWHLAARRQAVFFGSHFTPLLDEAVLGLPHRLGLAYFHGRPGQGDRWFDLAHQRLSRHHHRVDRVQVTNPRMGEVVLATGIDPAKVFTIPIGINLAFFPPQTPASRRAARQSLDIPESAVVVGSFQKDGVGWGEGREPKLIKGPDVLLRAVEQLRPKVPELFVLLSGPARGFVIDGLRRLDVPFRHVFVANYPDISRLYQALDLYLVASRDEGGPKAVLEAMASGVPVVSTRVGQAPEMIDPGRNGWLVEVEDAEGLAGFGLLALERRPSLGPLLAAARRTAQANAYESQDRLWAGMLRGFVDFPSPEVPLPARGEGRGEG
jgi:glycosyltransferase involved in cell wall biosynthesis